MTHPIPTFTNHEIDKILADATPIKRKPKPPPHNPPHKPYRADPHRIIAANKHLSERDQSPF